MGLPWSREKAPRNPDLRPRPGRETTGQAPVPYAQDAPTGVSIVAGAKCNRATFALQMRRSPWWERCAYAAARATACSAPASAGGRDPRNSTFEAHVARCPLARLRGTARSCPKGAEATSSAAEVLAQRSADHLGDGDPLSSRPLRGLVPEGRLEADRFHRLGCLPAAGAPGRAHGLGAGRAGSRARLRPRAPRSSDEALATGGDVRLVCDLFGLSVGGAERYARSASPPPSFDTLPSTVLDRYSSRTVD
jgi:hypothetical protein